jgi:hypothetical protein
MELRSAAEVNKIAAEKSATPKYLDHAIITAIHKAGDNGKFEVQLSGHMLADVEYTKSALQKLGYKVDWVAAGINEQDMRVSWHYPDYIEIPNVPREDRENPEVNLALTTNKEYFDKVTNVLSSIRRLIERNKLSGGPASISSAERKYNDGWNRASSNAQELIDSAARQLGLKLQK